MHRELVAHIEDCQAGVHSALLDNLDTATALSHILSALLSLYFLLWCSAITAVSPTITASSPAGIPLYLCYLSVSVLALCICA